MKMSWNNFAPRLGAIYRLNEETVVRAGYGVTYNATPWARAVRGDNDYPITIASTFVNKTDKTGFGYFAPLSAGIPIIAQPDQSSGRVPLDRAAAEYTPEIDNIDRGYVQTWNLAFERRLAYDISVDVAYVGAKGTDGYAALDINAPTTLGGGDPSRPYASLGRVIRIDSWGDRLKTKYQLDAGRAQQAVHARAAVQGRLHAEQVDERKRQRRPRDARPGIHPASSGATGDRQASIAGTTSSLASRISCRGRARAATTAS